MQIFYQFFHYLLNAHGFDGKVLTFGKSEGALFRGANIRLHEGGSSFSLSGPDIHGEFTVPLAGAHNIENALAALAAACTCGLDANSLRPALASFRNLAQRSEIITLPGPITILNDCYNSNPRAMERMIDTLASWSEGGRRIVVAGEMLELGSTSPEWHRTIGRKLAAEVLDATGGAGQNGPGRTGSRLRTPRGSATRGSPASATTPAVPAAARA